MDKPHHCTTGSIPELYEYECARHMEMSIGKFVFT